MMTSHSLWSCPAHRAATRLIEDRAYEAGQAAVMLSKVAGTPTPTHALAGRLYISASGWLMLSVPNSLARGAFDALDELGAELPTQDGKFNAHISVMSADEVEKIGGPDKITERGHTMRYQTGPVAEVRPDNWEEVSKVWYITVISPELRQLRVSYGLEPQRNGYDFHITFAIRRTNVLRHNEVTKAPSSSETAPSSKATALLDK